ncbi:bifunctional adenosylcobinamide kinase/adenosylcobinamide-phosphate guanylyltransferase [Pararhizobium haloflavum]|uniref:bifunctional adenosylcobinamide kinase/adenosylcobinamide-phosphate guanylyltransferase n=1 Tax=Pararhizobium haloflavum TaxID=2037914 RepID=UPI000C18E1D8|nr:bifunctional adenosylcobinamide kinase/adenosylcobinamide-phosphate guanylyltransferase [Pararhizobium haloflavum]
MRTVFVLGGARSGKTAFSEALAGESGLDRHYVATGRAWDDEMRARIDRHRAMRGRTWMTHETPLGLTQTLRSELSPARVVLVDCLTLWVTNLMMEEQGDAAIDAAFDDLVAVIQDPAGPLILVSNEVGLGIVPENSMARAFRDHAGRLHQKIAAAADEVYFIAAGLPLKMKG